MIKSNMKQFLAETNKEVEKLLNKQKEDAKKVVLFAYNELVLGSAVATGLYKSSHLIDYNSPVSDAPDTVDEGRINKQKTKLNIIKWNNGDKITISNSLKYAPILENVPNYSKKQAPFLYARTEAKTQKVINNATKY